MGDFQHGSDTLLIPSSNPPLAYTGVMSTDELPAESSVDV
jgi:hypothetical protein